MVSNPTSSSYQIFYLSSIERDRFKASMSPYDLETKIDIPFTSMKLFEPRLNVSDFEVGDLLKVKLKSQAGDFKSKPFVSSVDYKKDSTHLNILPAGFRPATIPLTSLGDLSERLPRVGKLKIFHRNGEIVMIMLGFKIVKLRNITAPVKKVVYITDIDSTQITTCDKLDYTGQYSVIQLSNLKSYNQSWTIPDLAKWDRIEIQYDSSNRPLSYKLLLTPAQVTRYGDTYQFNISNFCTKAMTASQLGDIAAAYLSSGMSNIKVLHTSGNIRAFVYKKIIIRVAKLGLTSSSAVSRGEETKTPKGKQKVNLPTKTEYRSAANETCKYYPTPQENDLSKVSNPIPNHSGAQSDYCLFDPDISISDLLAAYDMSTTNFSNTYILSRESNKRIHIKEVRKHFKIDEARFQELHSVFRHGRLFIKEKFGYFKAIGVGYLDHLCRKSTHPNVLNQFISSLESNFGLYQLNLQTKESRDLLILMLNSLKSERSIDALDDYYIHPDFMEAYIKELQNITYNKMIEERVHANLLESFRNNKLEPKEFLRFIGNALGVIIFTHSLKTSKPKFFKSENYSLVINLILRRNHAACLLYYNYFNGEDVNATTNKDKYRCKKCGSLPHEAYFANTQGDLCQRCYISSEKSGDLKVNSEESHRKQGHSLAKHGRRRKKSRHIKDTEGKTKKNPAQSRGISPELHFKPEELWSKKHPEEIQRQIPIINHDKLSKRNNRKGPKPNRDKPAQKYIKSIQEPDPAQTSNQPAASPRSVPSSKIPKPNLPTKVSQLPQALIHECDGCKVPTPINLLHKYCDSNHILCEKCVIISNKKHNCLSCELLISTSQLSHPSSSSSKKLCSLCSQRNPTQHLKCRHSMCTTCLQNHITRQIFDTALSTHIQAGKVRISCPASGCGESISNKIFYPLIPPNILDTYKSILSLLPANNCPKCNLSKSNLTDLRCHKICKNCLMNYFDVKLSRKEINFGCMMGCEHSFTAQELNELMNDKQRAKYQKICRGDQPENKGKQCPGCNKEYYNITGYYKFECKKCNTKFCGACGIVCKIHGQRRKGEHQPTCKFYRP